MKLTKLYSINEKNEVHDTLCTRKQKKKIFGHNNLKLVDTMHQHFLKHSMTISYY